MNQQPYDDESLGDLLARLVGRAPEATPGDPATPAGHAGPGARDWVRDLGRLTRALARSGRQAGRRSLLGGGWLADHLVDTVPRLPVRDADTLRAQHPGLSDDDLAQALISGAAKTTAAVGAAGGALAAVEFAAPPSLLSAPVQLAAETLLVAAAEVKLVAELHEVYGRPATGPRRTRGLSYLTAWSERRGIDPLAAGGVRLSFGAAAKRGLRKRLVRRAGRNLSTLGPLFSGAVAGSVVNHRETRRLGEQVRDDLRRTRAARTIPGEIVPRAES